MDCQYDHGGNVFAIARQLGVAAERILDFSASINPLGMSSMVRNALLASFDSLVHYPDAGHQELKQSLARHHGLSPSNFTVANGSTALLYNLPAMLKGKKALIISPSFSEYQRALALHHWEVSHFVLSPENDFAIDFKRLEKVLANRFDALYICNPGNPTGTLYSLALIGQILDCCSSTGTFMVLDEAFMDFCEEASAKSMIAASDNAVVLRSMTKFYGIPGLRLGYAISSNNLAERLALMAGPWSVNTLALVSGIAALDDVSHNMTTLEYVERERQLLYKQLALFSDFRLFPSSTNYLLVALKGGMTAGQLRERLQTCGILVRDCSSFTGLTDRFFRIAVRTGKENARLLESLALMVR